MGIKALYGGSAELLRENCIGGNAFFVNKLLDLFIRLLGLLFGISEM